MKETIQTAVVGVTGYAGAELARLLLHHPRLKGKPPVFAGRVDAKDAARGGIPLAEIHPELAGSNGSGNLKQEPFSWDLLTSRGVEVLFLATPHEQSREWVPEALARGIRVIDLSGAWRLTDAANRAVYTFDDEGSDACRRQLRRRPSTACLSCIAPQSPARASSPTPAATQPPSSSPSAPGCCGPASISTTASSPTPKAASAARAKRPLPKRISCTRPTISPPTASSPIATPASCLSRSASTKARSSSRPICCPFRAAFSPPSTFAFARRRRQQAIARVYHDFFAASPMVRLYDKTLPQIQYSVRTNYADIGFQIAADGRRAVIVSCLDNLLKGASGQAVQNMNVMLGWPKRKVLNETRPEGLE